MRCCLRLTAEGVRVGWVDKDTELAPSVLRHQMCEDEAPAVLAIDDADLYGLELSGLLRDIVVGGAGPLVLIAIRSGKVDALLNPAVLEGIPMAELSMPPLADPDIDALLDVLDREHRLGVLKGVPRSEQVRAFKQKAGRQLLVAMLEATSGRRFEEKIYDELLDFDEIRQRIYATVAVATALRESLRKNEVLVACGEMSNLALNAIDELLRRHVLVQAPQEPDAVRARHRMIAQVLMDELTTHGQLSSVLEGLVLVAAARIAPGTERTGRPWRLLRQVINHEFLARTAGADVARRIYGTAEPVLTWDAHFWLQRGSLEVECGDLALAENFLNQASSLAPDDPLVETECAYLDFKKALEHPSTSEAEDIATEAIASLEALIGKRGTKDPYPYHILGSQGLAWARRGIIGREKKARFLRSLLRRVDEGCDRHPRAEELVQLRRDLQREIMLLGVGDADGGQLTPDRAPAGAPKEA